MAQSTESQPINAQDAGLFSAAAYTPIGYAVNTGNIATEDLNLILPSKNSPNSTVTPLPPGWVDITSQVVGTAPQGYSDST
jgi:hypothetical protein